MQLPKPYLFERTQCVFCNDTTSKFSDRVQYEVYLRALFLALCLSLSLYFLEQIVRAHGIIFHKKLMIIPKLLNQMIQKMDVR